MRLFMVQSRVMAVGLCASIWLSSLGCSGGTKGPDLYPVSGKVTFQGKPLAGAKLMFISAAEDPKKPPAERPAAETDAEGSYELTWGDEAGAPAGKYKVMIFAFKEVDDTHDSESKPPSLIPEKYNSPAGSALTAVVKEDGENVANFDLVK